MRLAPERDQAAHGLQGGGLPSAHLTVLFGLSMLAMYADSWWVPNPAATDLAALIFIPWGLTLIWSLLSLVNLAACACATVKAARNHPVPDYQRIAELEADLEREL